MALAIGTKTYDLRTPSASSYSFSHSQDTGSDRYLFVCIAMADVSTVAGVTYGGVAMTKLTGHNPTAYGADWSMWSLANPAQGSNTLAVTLSAAQYNPVSTVVMSATGCAGFGQTNWGDTGFSEREISLTGLQTTSKLLISGFAGASASSIYTGTTSPASTMETRLWNHAINNYTYGGLSSITLASTSYVKVATNTQAALFVAEIKEATAAVVRKRFHIT